MCPSAHPQEEVGMTGKLAWPKGKIEARRFFRTFGAGPGAPCPLQCQLCLIVSVQKKEECPFLSQNRKWRLRRAHDQGKDWNTGSGVLSVASCCSLLIGPQAGPPSPRAEVWVESAKGLGTQVTMTSLPSAKAQSAYLLILLFIVSPALLLPSRHKGICADA